MATVNPNQIILVRFDRVYGKVLCYPANPAACRIAEIARQKTLSPYHLKLCRELDLTVQLTPNSIGLLDELVDSFILGEVA